MSVTSTGKHANQKQMNEIVSNLNNSTSKTINPYDEFTLGDLKVLEETI
jgi:hypothetical protein